MKAFALDGFGEQGSVRELPDPEPGEGQVRIRVAAAGLNPFDGWVIAGALKDDMEHRFPLVPAADASGTVDAVGPGVSDLAVGDEVFGSVGKPLMGEGSLAELATMSTATIARKPASVSHEDAAAIPIAGVTALNMVDAVPIAEGHVVVVIGATGGVGSYLTQIATTRGARAVAINSSANAEYARSLGAADVIAYDQEDVVEGVRSRHPDGIDGVADLHRDQELVASLSALVRSGGYVVSATGGADVDALTQRGLTAVNASGRVATEALDTIASLLEREAIVSPELHRFMLDQGTAAFALVTSGHVRGKVVVIPSEA
jgi:NADPH:quinone reductase-like Zn-dependent oxidoreductase